MPNTTNITGILGLQQDDNHLDDPMEGIPTFRGAGGLWRTYQAQELATPQAFRANPSLVWEFYHYRREVVARCKPNPGNFALAAFQRKLAQEGKQVDIVTQNIDRLHRSAGGVDVVELHGSLWLLKALGELTHDYVMTGYFFIAVSVMGIVAAV